MGRLSYTILMSLDGFIEDRDGRFDWAAPDEQVHRFINDLERQVSTHLYGRRMYDVMQVWQAIESEAGRPDYLVDYARIWRAADKVVFSSSLAVPATPRTRLLRVFDPDSVAELVNRAGTEVSIGGPGLAAEAFGAGLVDVVRLFIAPIVVGGGKPALPPDGRIDLELRRSRQFGNGMLFVEYAVRYAGAARPEERAEEAR